MRFLNKIKTWLRKSKKGTGMTASFVIPEICNKEDSSINDNENTGKGMSFKLNMDYPKEPFIIIDSKSECKVEGRKGKNSMLCCFCNTELMDIGNSPYPFLRKENPTGCEYGCCDKCNKLFVTPARHLLKYNIRDDDWNMVLYEIKSAFEKTN